MASQVNTFSVDGALRRIKAQPGRAAALAILVLVMGGMWARFLLVPGGGAAPALAIVQPDPPARPAADNQRLSPGKSLKDFLSRPGTPSRRNLFAVNMDYYPTDGSRPVAQPDANDGFWDQVAKSLAAKADQEKQKRFFAESVKRDAARLRLQSTMMNGSTPRALINGTLVAAGDVVDGFRIVRIEARRIVVEREGVRLEVLFSFNK